jgi:SAM-dependent methyltransferase
MFNKLSIRKLASRLYWWIKGIHRTLFGTRVDEAIWEKKSHTHVRKNLVNVSLPHRAWLVDKILTHLESTPQEKALSNHTSILEIGCGCGANLEVIARRAPFLRLIGIDISSASISVGRDRFAEIGLRDITLIEGKADDLSAFSDASIDVVFTDAVFLYIGPDKIKTCIEEMRRISRRAIILLEMHIDGIGSDGVYTRDGFVRDYRALCNHFSDDIKLTCMPKDKRPAGRWPKYGTLIEVTLPRQYAKPRKHA